MLKLRVTWLAALAVLCGYLWVVVGIAMWIAAVVIAWMYRREYDTSSDDRHGREVGNSAHRNTKRMREYPP